MVGLEREVLERKTRILRGAARLRNDYQALGGAENWLDPSDYAEGADELERRRKERNKYRRSWFTQVGGCVVNEVKSLPDDDADKLTLLPGIAQEWAVIVDELRRVRVAEEGVVKKEIFDDAVFQQMVKDFGLEESDSVFLFSFVHTGNENAAAEHLWAFKSVQDKFEGKEEKFREWFGDNFQRWSANYQKARKERAAIGKAAVEAGDRILDLVIERLSK